jgi:uncharacterized GH25 family protein
MWKLPLIHRLIRRCGPIGIFILATNTASVSAHEFWLEPTRFAAPEGTEVGFDIRIGQYFNGRAYPYIDRETESFIKRTDAGIAEIKAFTGDKPAVTLELEGRATWVAYTSNDFNIRFRDTEKFTNYLKDEGLEWVLDWYREQGKSLKDATESYYRHAKALSWSGPQEPQWLSESLGMRIELVPDTGFLRCSQPARFRALYQGEPLEGHLVRRFRKGSEEVEQFRADSQGYVEFPAGEGPFLLNVVHIEDASNPRAKGKDWISDWASLTYTCAN